MSRHRRRRSRAESYRQAHKLIQWALEHLEDEDYGLAARRCREAIAMFENDLRRNPRAEEAYGALGRAFMILAEIEAGEANVKEAIAACDQALATFDAALKLVPDSLESLEQKALALSERGALQIELGRYAEASASLESSIAVLDKILRPEEDAGAHAKKANALFQLSVAYAALNRPEDCLASVVAGQSELDRAIELDPDDDEIRDLRDELQEAIDDFPEMKAALATVAGAPGSGNRARQDAAAGPAPGRLRIVANEAPARAPASLSPARLEQQARKAEEFLKLHQGPEVLVLPNVWDVASARIAQRAGFRAIATSSAAIANSLGYPDGQRISREEMLAVVKRIAEKVALPVTADLEAGYSDRPEDMIDTAREMIAAGAVGLNLEDGTNDPERPLIEPEVHVEKIRRIREVGKAHGIHVVINARTDVYLAQLGEPATRFEQAVRRLRQYREAGADCLFVPGIHDAETIGKLVQAVDSPLNVLAGPATPSIAELQRLKVRRVSFGSWPARAALGLFAHFTRELREQGTFTTLASWAIPYAELNNLVS